VQHLAHHDALTDLPNRLLLTDRLRQAAAQAKRDNIRLALMYLDLDNFKPVNDTLGHNVGDLLLQQVASRLLGCVKRESDTVARLGGDEFVVLLPHIEKGSDAATIAECILDALTRPFDINGSTINISSSIGIAIYPESAQEVHELMKNADTAMYEAKKAGRSCIRFFEPDESVGIPETDN
jgi:diguanylate cyclase (GGDEF)-like protein